MCSEMIPAGKGRRTLSISFVNVVIITFVLVAFALPFPACAQSTLLRPGNSGYTISAGIDKSVESKSGTGVFAIGSGDKGEFDFSLTYLRHRETEFVYGVVYRQLWRSGGGNTSLWLGGSFGGVDTKDAVTASAALSPAIVMTTPLNSHFVLQLSPRLWVGAASWLEENCLGIFGAEASVTLGARVTSALMFTVSPAGNINWQGSDNQTSLGVSLGVVLDTGPDHTDPRAIRHARHKLKEILVGGKKIYPEDKK